MPHNFHYATVTFYSVILLELIVLEKQNKQNVTGNHNNSYKFT